jgi:hypothetical protein
MNTGNAVAGKGYTSNNWRTAFGSVDLSEREKDELLDLYGGQYLRRGYQAIRGLGYGADESYRIFSAMDEDGNNSLKQAEVARYLMDTYGDTPEAERIWDAIARANGWQSNNVPRSWAWAKGRF